MTKRERERERENSCKRENETRTETWKGKTTEARPTPPHPELHSQLFSNEKNKQSLKKKPQGCYRGEQKKSRREFRDWEKERKKSTSVCVGGGKKKTEPNLSVSLPSVGARPRPFLPAFPPPPSGHRVLLRLPVLGEVRLERVDVALEAQGRERPEQVVAVDRLALLALALVGRLSGFVFFSRFLVAFFIGCRCELQGQGSSGGWVGG